MSLLPIAHRVHSPPSSPPPPAGPASRPKPPSKKNRRKEKGALPFSFLCQGLLVLGLLVLSTHPAWAGGSGMPWEGPLDQALNSITGPVAKAIGAIAILGLGLGMAFSEGGSMMRKALWVVMGLALGFNALSFGLPFLGFSGGLLV